MAPGTVQAAAAKDRGLPGPHRLPADDPHRFLRDQGARHLCAKERRMVYGHLPPRRPAAPTPEQA